MARNRRKHQQPVNIWPGYVDALSTLVMIVIFVLLVFVIGQQFLSSVITQREHALDSLKQNIHHLTDMLSLKDQQITALNQKTKLQEASLINDAAQAAQNQAITSNQLEQISTLSAQIAELTQQLAAISSALDIEKQNETVKDAKINELGEKLNIALADKVNLLKRYRSEFFEKLSALLKNHEGIEVVGDRFVFQSEILFPVGSATLSPAGKEQIHTLAQTLKEVAATIPADLPWILRVDGHADKQPIHTAFPSNWELSSARAITVVKMLISDGIDPHHLAATGFSDYQPLEKGNNAKSYAHNRRIEFRLTDR